MKKLRFWVVLEHNASLRKGWLFLSPLRPCLKHWNLTDLEKFKIQKFNVVKNLFLGAIVLILCATQLIPTDGTLVCKTVGQGKDETSIWQVVRDSLHLQHVNHSNAIRNLVENLKELRALLESFKRPYVSWGRWICQTTSLAPRLPHLHTFKWICSHRLWYSPKTLIYLCNIQ